METFIKLAHHVFHAVNRGRVHDLYLGGVLGRDPVLLALVVQKLHLARV